MLLCYVPILTVNYLYYCEVSVYGHCVGVCGTESTVTDPHDPQVTQLYVPSARHVWRTRRMGRIGPLQSTLDGTAERRPRTTDAQSANSQAGSGSRREDGGVRMNVRRLALSGHRSPPRFVREGERRAGQTGCRRGTEGTQGRSVHRLLALSRR